MQRKSGRERSIVTNMSEGISVFFRSRSWSNSGNENQDANTNALKVANAGQNTIFSEENQDEEMKDDASVQSKVSQSHSVEEGKEDDNLRISNQWCNIFERDRGYTTQTSANTNNNTIVNEDLTAREIEGEEIGAHNSLDGEYDSDEES